MVNSKEENHRLKVGGRFQQPKPKSTVPLGLPAAAKSGRHVPSFVTPEFIPGITNTHKIMNAVRHGPYFKGDKDFRGNSPRVVETPRYCIGRTLKGTLVSDIIVFFQIREGVNMNCEI